MKRNIARMFLIPEGKATYVTPEGIAYAEEIKKVPSFFFDLLGFFAIQIPQIKRISRVFFGFTSFVLLWWIFRTRHDRRKKSSVTGTLRRQSISQSIDRVHCRGKQTILFFSLIPQEEALHPERQASSATAESTVTFFSNNIVKVPMNMHNPWKLERWHVRSALRQFVSPKQTQRLCGRLFSHLALHFSTNHFKILFQHVCRFFYFRRACGVHPMRWLNCRRRQ